MYVSVHMGKNGRPQSYGALDEITMAHFRINNKKRRLWID